MSQGTMVTSIPDFVSFLSLPRRTSNYFPGQVLIAPNSALTDLLQVILCRNFDSIAQCFPNLVARGTLWLRKMTTDPHIIARVNIQYPDYRNPKLKMDV